MNEAGKFLLLTDCIMTWEDHISFLMCFVMFPRLWFLLVHQNLTVSRARTKPIWSLRYKGKHPKSSSSTCLPDRSPCHPVPNKHSQFLDSIKRLWKPGPTKTTERPVWWLSSFFFFFYLPVKHITVYLNRVQDKHTVLRGTSSKRSSECADGHVMQARGYAPLVAAVCLVCRSSKSVSPLLSSLCNTPPLSF